MRVQNDIDSSRRRFLRFLAGSPLLAYAHRASTSPNRPDASVLASSSQIASPSEAINVFDLETVARRNLAPAHFGYIATGMEDDVTLRANREGFLKFKIRARRLVDSVVSKNSCSAGLASHGLRLFG